ncbi:MAG: YicC family protein [Bacteroidales bacterium]|nr:YicC family protein [Bacteroidales bacterium]
MIQSMTGYGKAETVIENRKYIVEIRSLNGKNCDLGIKSQLLPRDRELQVRKYIADTLVRGNIDLFITMENAAGDLQLRNINEELFVAYWKRLCEIAGNVDITDGNVISTILKLPDVVSSSVDTTMDEEQCELLIDAVKDAVTSLISFRTKEGEILKEDLLTRVANILSTLEECEQYEALRIDSIRSRILPKLEELEVTCDSGRFEQEMIFYIEKLDVNEEKVRLSQHCNYFRETMENEQYPGRKLGFIAQEMGREINTLGSKSNNADMQRCVVRMKDELEKIKEQVLNVL